jgi:hypothetical protein
MSFAFFCLGLGRSFLAACYGSICKRKADTSGWWLVIIGIANIGASIFISDLGGR